MPAKGIGRVQANLKVKISEIADRRTEKALLMIAKAGRANADTMTPVDLGNLINSGYAPTIMKGEHGMSAVVGYTANYAAAVHEKPTRSHNVPRANGNGYYWDPSGEPGFLEKGFEEVRPNVHKILKEVYKK